MRAAWWWIDRWRKSSAYTDMTAEEQGLYRNLLDEVWLRDDHIIPDDFKALAQISGDYEAWQRSGDKVLKWMKKIEGGWTNTTAIEVIQQSEGRAERQKRYRDKQRNTDHNENHNDNNNSMCSPSPSPSPSPSKTQSPIKNKYGEFQNVLLTDDEYTKLREKFKSSLEEMIERLSEGIASKGYKYKSHYATILSWDRKDKKESGTSTQQPQRKQYTRPDELD